MATATDSPDWRHFWESYVTDGEPETVDRVLQPTENKID